MSRRFEGFAYMRGFIWCLAAVLILAISPSVSAQKNKKNKNADTSSQPAAPAPALPDPQELEEDIGQMLAGFQLGDVEVMHKYYADNVTFVSGAFEPPLIGWQNYVPVYQRERASFPAMQLNRKNTLIFTHGDVAWAMYQWEFDSTYNGQPYSVRGQTTLIFNKVGGNWLIVHNHTSEIIPTASPVPPQQAPPAGNAPRP